jgi:hypothetical protein
MRAFDVYLNQKKLCRAGVGDDGVLSAIVNWVTGRDRGDLFPEVGGLISPQKQHVHWVRQKPLRVGDRIQVRIIETTLVDKPVKQPRTDPAVLLRAKKQYLRMMAKELGWKIQPRPK